MSFICGAGSTNVDLLYSGMKRIPDVGEELFSKDFSLKLGGGVPATLINLARLGINTRIATSLGNDIFSEFAKKEFKDAGADVINMYSGNEIPLTVTSAVILEKDRTFFSYSGWGKTNANADEIFYNTAKGSKITLMQTGEFIEVYKKLKAEGTILVLDTGWDDGLSLEAYSDYLELADYYTPNRKEAIKITGEKTPENAAEKLKKYFDKVIVKLDSEGCIGIEDGETFTVKSIDEFKNVDSTGAGDAFLAGLCYGIYNGYPLRDSILFGNITGGKSVTAIGALSAYLNEKELLDYYNKYKK